ncbi:MAG: DUF2842 domain-containing protein [Caulobacterales bacterium]|nr:DUF2842 domain-containing protein [Caulobacterales bacterium]
MNPRIRKLVGMVAILLFLVLYVSAAVAIADHLPRHPAVSLIYFAIVGVAWGLPLFPLMSWMNREPKPKD